VHSGKFTFNTIYGGGNCYVIANGGRVTDIVAGSSGDDCLVVFEGGRVDKGVSMDKGNDVVYYANNAILAGPTSLGEGDDMFMAAKIGSTLATVSGDGGADTIQACDVTMHATLFDLIGGSTDDAFSDCLSAARVENPGTMEGGGAEDYCNTRGPPIFAVKNCENYLCPPTAAPTKFPTKYPSIAPTNAPTNYPTAFPTRFPTKYPSMAPTPRAMTPIKVCNGVNDLALTPDCWVDECACPTLRAPKDLCHETSPCLLNECVKK
jgi:hypothetical protein